MDCLHQSPGFLIGEPWSGSVRRYTARAQAGGHGCSDVQIASVGEIACVIAAEVVALRDHRARAISAEIVRHNAVTYYGCYSRDAADGPGCRIPSNRAAVYRVREV